VYIKPVIFLNLTVQYNAGQSGVYEMVSEVILNLKINLLKYLACEALWDRFRSMIVRDRVFQIVVTFQNVTYS
jgi:hypothetical protein